MRKLIPITTAAVLVFCGQAGNAQTKSAPAAKAQPVAPRVEIHATLSQLMKGIVYPSSNVVFAAQNHDPAEMKPGQNPAMSTDLLLSTYGQWQAVENSALAIVEASNLMILPGRKCSNGVAVPIQSADWAKFVHELREGGMEAYKAAQAKSQDGILMAAEPLTNACSHCHDKYREKPTLAERCKP
jgi:hypothetical protein